MNTTSTPMSSVEDDAESTDNPIRTASKWRLSYQGRVNIMDADKGVEDCQPTEIREAIRAFDLHELQFVWLLPTCYTKESERAYRQKKRLMADTKRFLRIPDLEIDYPAERLRQFIDEEVKGPEGDNLYIAACSDRPFRHFKDAASQEVVDQWRFTEGMEKRGQLYDYLVELGIKVEDAEVCAEVEAAEAKFVASQERRAQAREDAREQAREDAREQAREDAREQAALDRAERRLEKAQERRGNGAGGAARAGGVRRELQR